MTLTNEHKYMMYAAAGLVAWYMYQKYTANSTAATNAVAQQALANQAYLNANPTIQLDPNWQNAVAPIAQDAGNVLPQAQCNAAGGTWANGACVMPVTLQGFGMGGGSGGRRSLAAVPVRRKAWGE